MRTRRRIQARLGGQQTRDWYSAQDVRLNNLIYIFQTYTAIPHRFRVDNDVRPVLALVKAAGFVRTDLSFESQLRKFALKGFLQLGLAGWITASARAAWLALIGANEDVTLELRHFLKDNSKGSQEYD